MAARRTAAALMCVAAFFVSTARAATQDGALRVEVITAYNLVVDSNAGTPASYAPRSAYIGVTFHNDGSVPLTDLVANIGNYNDGVSPTPGIYPARKHDGLRGPLTDGAFALEHEGGSSGLADATRYIASIPAGDSVTVYWLIGYDQLDEDGVPLWGASVKPDDDLWLEYDVWASASDGGTTRNVDMTRTLTFRNEITASANKIFPNGANKVPDYYKDLLNQYVPVWTNANRDGTVGTRIVTEGIWYDFGNVGEGFDNDGDFVPDRNAWMQPVGDPSLYDAGAFRLVKTYAMVIVKLIDGGEMVLTGEDQLYFEHIPDNNGAVGYVRYEFMPLLANARSVTTPYQEVASGYDNEKYNADYGVSLGNGLISGEARVTLDKNASVTTVAAGGSIAYSVAYTNSGVVSAGDPTIGLPLVVQDSVPAGTAYVSGSATAANTLPSGVSSYTVFYSTDGGVTWTQTEPDAALVTDLQWWLSDELPAGAAGVIRFSVNVDNPYLEPSPVVHNVAGISFGDTAPFATDDADTIVLGNNVLGDTVYADTGVGTGGSLGNGIQDGSEPGIAGVLVYLRADVNANGIADADELLFAAAETDANGHYLFSNLPDGRYVATVDIEDSSIPFGYTVTTPSSFAIDLDSAHATSSSVTNLTADFGFAPALAASKMRVGTGDLREGQLVTYLIPVTNRLAGDGSPDPQPARYTVWPTNGVAGTGDNKSWTDAVNAWHPGEPDGQYAMAPFKDTKENIVVSGFYHVAQPGTITNVTLLLPIVINGSFAGTTSELDIYVRTNNVQFGALRTYLCSALSSGTLAINITGDKPTWSWSDFNGVKFSVELVSQKQANPSGTISLDSAGFRLTTDRTFSGGSEDTTLDPVPLFDNFDPMRLRYVSAVPPIDSYVTNSAGLGELFWSDLGPIYAGGGRMVSVTFKVLEPPGNVSAPVTNTAAITNAWFVNGRKANEQYGTNIATALPAGTIGDRLWRDFNANGVQDAGEPGIAGVTVTVRPPTGVTLASTTTVTDVNGNYLFESLPASGVYTVAVATATLPGGSGTPTWDYDGITTANRAAVTIVYDSTTGADKNYDVDFGYTLQSTIRGTLWDDLDRDHAEFPEDGEDRLTNVTVRLYTSGGTLLATTNTAANGTFQFVGAGITNGDYIVRVTNTGSLATGTWTRSFDTDGTNSANQVTVTVPLGGLGIADFSYYRTGTLSIGDTIYYDWDGDGDQDPTEDEGIGGVTVWLYQDEDGDGVVDAGVDALVATTSTATNGLYLFSGLVPATYQVVVDKADPNMPAFRAITGDPYGAFDGISVLTLTTTNNLAQDFGFHPNGVCSIGDTVWYDSNGDGIQMGAMEVGIGDVTVSLYADLDGDGSFFLVRAMATDANGIYQFSSLPNGYYRVVVDTNSSALPTDAFGDRSRPTTPTSFSVQLTGSDYLDADFGFVLPGAIGDTVYWDYNGNGDQDWTEPGIPNVTLRLYVDNNANGVYDTGDTYVGSQITDADGKYIFHQLPPARYVVVVDPTSPPLSGATLTADPNNDGEPCPIPATSGPSCDAQYGVLLTEESTFRGADFGYQPPGIIGDTVWLDVNTNGIRDAGELGIPYVPVVLYTNGTPVATNYTDFDGIYLFGGLADGTYSVGVITADTNFPSGLAAVYDADGTPDSVANTVVIGLGHITSVGGQSVTNADLTIDFGYRYVGSDNLSGTIGMDAPVYDGLLNGDNPSGVGTGEYPFTQVSVALHLWQDDGDRVVEAGETTPIATTSTDANGDYAFDGLPSATDTNSLYLVGISAPAGGLSLTTQTGDTPAMRVGSVTNSLGWTLSAYQLVAIVPAQTNIDFAFKSLVLRDFGDLPVSYSTTVGNLPDGPRHALVTGQDLWLGASLDTEYDGQPTLDASGDGGDEDGVEVVGRWTDGGNSGHLVITVGAGSGWLVGWIDFNQDGRFTNANERVINQAVDSGGTGAVYALSFPIPAGTFQTNDITVLNARFRLYPSEPTVALFSGGATGGEVEDYQFKFGAIGDYAWEDFNGNGVQDAGEPVLAGITATLYDGASNVVDTMVTSADGRYLFTGLGTGVYQVVFGSYSNFTATAQLAGGSVTLDNNADTNGVTAATNLTAAAFVNDVDAGYYRPAKVFGYIFYEELPQGIRDAGDSAVTNIGVYLVDTNGTMLAETFSDANGYYSFDKLPPGSYALRFWVRLEKLTLTPGGADPERNRIDAASEGFYDIVLYSGDGLVLSEAEPYNVGLTGNPPLATSIAMCMYNSSEGVFLDFQTVQEVEAYRPIVIYRLMPDGTYVELGRVMSGGGDQSYNIKVDPSLLNLQGLNRIVIIDESDARHELLVSVAPAPFAAEMVQMTKQGLTLTWRSLPGSVYDIFKAPTPSGPWTLTVTEVYADGDRCSTIVPVNPAEPQAFFKIVMRELEP
ncbi:MAG: SdrD B-like domain-containing protein [Kiritimatiellae bacterium]|nr:SdrD B-like domain-containing protein [Kiritimatiellia bacterium]